MFFDDFRSIVNNQKKLCNFLNVKFESKMLNTRKYIDYSTGKIWFVDKNNLITF